MARKHAKRMGPVAYYLYRDARSYQAGKPPLHTKFGPYASMKEAEAKREEEESGGLHSYSQSDLGEPVNPFISTQCGAWLGGLHSLGPDVMCLLPVTCVQALIIVFR
jgi:hypothetical protein